MRATAVAGTAAINEPLLSGSVTSLTTGTSGTPTISNAVIDPQQVRTSGTTSSSIKTGTTVSRTTRTTTRKKTTKKTSTVKKEAPAPAVEVSRDADGNPVVTNVKPAATSTNPPKR